MREGLEVHEDARDGSRGAQSALTWAPFAFYRNTAQGILHMARRPFFPSLLSRTLLAGALAQAPVAAWAADDPVVARIGAQDIHQSDVAAYYDQLTASQPVKLPLQMVMPQVVELMINEQLVGAAAEQSGLANQPEVKAAMDYAADQVLQQKWLEAAIAEKLATMDLKAEYDRRVADLNNVQEVHARHILVEDEETARALLKEAQGGADFAALAKEHSTGPSAGAGGDLGYFGKDEMVEPFAEAAFAAKPGTVVAEPVQTQFGWHVIKVEDRRDKEPPSFDALTPQIEDELSQEIVEDVLDSLRTQAEVEVLIPSTADPENPAAD